MPHRALYAPTTNPLLLHLRALADDERFSQFVTAVIVLAGIVVGVETYPSMIERHGHVLHFLNTAIVWIFVAECLIKIAANSPHPWNYFRDPWNIFDFIIVVVALLPFDSEAVALLRLLRLLRVLRLVRALPGLQVLVGALLKSIPSMGYVAVLLGMLFYVYAVAAVLFFGHNDPRHFEDIPVAMLTLFGCVTGEAWVDVMYTNMYGCANYGYDGIEALCTNSKAQPLLAALFFCSFMMVGAMVMLNLFIGVITNGMEETRAENAELEREARGETPATLADDLALVQQQLVATQEALVAVLRRAKEADGATEGPKADV